MDDGIDWSRRHEAKTRARIVDSYYEFMIRLVKRKIRKLPACCDQDAMLSAASLGLLAAIDTFDGDKAAFKTHAHYRIIGAMCDALRNSDTLGRNDRSLVKKRAMATEQLTKALDRPPTAEEIMAKMGWTEKQYRRSLQLGKPSDIADKQIATKSTTKQVRLLIEDSERFREFTRGISMDGQTILYLYYFKQASMIQIAEVLGVSKARVSQMHGELLKELKAKGKEHFTG
jgi:RNA polymerase sigma factor for flagellar operon FliA